MGIRFINMSRYRYSVSALGTLPCPALPHLGPVQLSDLQTACTTHHSESSIALGAASLAVAVRGLLMVSLSSPSWVE